MNNEKRNRFYNIRLWDAIKYLYNLFAPRAVSVIIFGALFCNLAAKFYHAVRMELLEDYLSWIFADVAVLVSIEAVLAFMIIRWPGKKLTRFSLMAATVVCTWSVINAGWIIRTGTQILPPVLLPLFRAPLNTCGVIGVNLAKMPFAAISLLGPSAAALAFVFFAMVNPVRPKSSAAFSKAKFFFSLFVIFASIAGYFYMGRGETPLSSVDLRFNSQLKAITIIFPNDNGRDRKLNLKNSQRIIPKANNFNLANLSNLPRLNPNIVFVILEGIQYRHTSLYEKESGLTPYLEQIASEGVEFRHTNSSLTHTTKALFALMTGRYPSTNQDLAETVPARSKYASLASILKDQRNYRTAFFQSAKGNFEARAALINNLGFDIFKSREDFAEPNDFIGYLGCDEFALLRPTKRWIEDGKGPFFLTVLCSVSHDPYEVPGWFGEPAKEPVQRYRQTIAYTDLFIDSLDTMLKDMGLGEDTILCVIGDHGEAFGEHGKLGHERVVFQEGIHVPWVMRANRFIDPKTVVNGNTSSVDLAPTILSLLGFDISRGNFDGIDALGVIGADRKTYFSGWMYSGPAGFVQGDKKYVFNPTNKTLTCYSLAKDPFELVRLEIDDINTENIAADITNWKNDTLFRIDQQKTGKIVLYNEWLCRWSDRICSAKLKRKN